MADRPDTTELSQYQYDPRSRRYRNRTTGRYLSASDVRSAVDTIIDSQALKMRDLASRLVNGELALSDWQMQSAALLKALHVALGLAANGGLANTSASDLGYLASQIKEQYKYLNKMALQIRKGEQPLDGTLVSRAALYAQAGREIYENVVQRAAENAGMSQSRSVLGPADHCGECVDEAARGWVPIGQNIPIGQRTCLANCHCALEFR